MAGFRVRATATVPDLTGVIASAIGPAVERRARRMGEAMVESVESSVAKYKVRPANRRRNPGSTRITTGWSYKIVGDPTSTPIFVNLLARGDGAYQQRIKYLNDGTSGHQIKRGQARSASGQFGASLWLRFPKGEAITGPPWNYAKQVQHPGHEGDHFIEEALQAGIAAARGR